MGKKSQQQFTAKITVEITFVDGLSYNAIKKEIEFITMYIRGGFKDDVSTVDISKVQLEKRVIY